MRLFSKNPMASLSSLRANLRKHILFIGLFVILGFIALQIPFTRLAGSKTTFTAFDFFGPIATGFIGTVPGVIAVFLMQFLNFLLHGAKILDAGTIIRFFPMLFAAFYFSKKRRTDIIIPALAILAFTLHPIGRTVWYFSLFWLIPIIAHFSREKFLIARALGATFTAHAVGGALWIYAFRLQASVWNSLIPIVIVERALFALFIAASYFLLNNLTHFVGTRKLKQLEALVNRNELWSFNQ